MENPEKAKAMGLAGRKFVLDNFAWDVIVEKYMNYFKQVAHEE